MTPKIERVEHPAAFRERVADFLAARPVEHNLLATLLAQRAERPAEGAYWLAAAEDGSVCGVALQSPFLRPINLSVMAPEVAVAMAAAIAAEDIRPPGATGVADTAARFTGEWTERRETGARPRDGLRIYQQTDARTSSPPPGGTLRQARAADRPLLVDWTAAFAAEVGDRAADPEAMVDQRLRDGLLFFWDVEERPRCLAGHSVPVFDTARIQIVYTPPDLRGSGHASGAVTALSERLRRAGRRRILYTTLENPIANRLYRRIGYRAVAEVLAYDFL